MSTSVLRRYTPPTCTLEIAATGSALSRWTDRMVLKNLRFYLSFDDPKLPSEKQVTIKGDRTQLEALCEAVEAYVQTVLNQPSGQLSLLNQPSNSVESANPVNLSQTDLHKFVEAGIYLQPKGLLAHELCLGSLASEESGATIRLTVLQLFDLANALDEYHAEALILPALGRPAWLKSPAGWARAAAALVLAVGATSAVARFVMDVSNPTGHLAATNRQVEITGIQSPPEAPPNLPAPPSPPAISPLPLDPNAPLLPPKPSGEGQPPIDPNSPASISAVPVDQLPAPKSLSDPSASIPTTDGVTTEIPAPTEAPVATLPPEFAQPDIARTSATAIAPIAPLSPSAPEIGRDEARINDPLADAPIESPPVLTDETPVATTGGTVFDTYPQVAEVRQYFEENWQPPDELAQLNQALQYRLILNADGTIERIIPIGRAAAQFIDRTNMPLMGDPFVSALEDRDQLQVRLVLNPDGKVQTFQEGN
ncbi:MAG: DUF4335 domain-containing protein [Cyanobacteria bacterium CRU_2_1]|nr:DUF4335 domain-containing protein [Cyanobacteria bacterium RU_5_0]NJR57979.1 DUF4335 domain-containing protein [Cyanobacteria bacterium CRU_2_1]